MINYLSKFNCLSIKLITCQNKLIADQKMNDYVTVAPQIYYWRHNYFCRIAKFGKDIGARCVLCCRKISFRIVLPLIWVLFSHSFLRVLIVRGYMRNKRWCKRCGCGCGCGWWWWWWWCTVNDNTYSTSFLCVRSAVGCRLKTSSSTFLGWKSVASAVIQRRKISPRRDLRWRRTRAAGRGESMPEDVRTIAVFFSA